MKYFAVLFVSMLFYVVPAIHATAQANEDKIYVGSEVCKECHEGEYSTFKKYAKKSTSFKSIIAMKTKITTAEFESCFECHTTGYGEKGGFVSEEKTPELKNAGCEVCHGPGSLHVDTGGDPDEIYYNLDINDCTKCHNESRVKAFNFKPLLFGGAH
ncbi:MAG: cytochrome c family protein [Desulfobacteraceae bacterium]|nr:cytochrome c family protein [Desulfobacteraceae bacterium]